MKNINLKPLPLKVPEVYKKQIINNKILYSDKGLPKRKLNCAIIPNIDIYSFEKCLEIMFKSNSNVIFDTIQYSQTDKKLYFYATEEINTLAWEEAIKRSSVFSDELRNILSTEENKDVDSISLFEVSKLIKQERNRYEAVKRHWENRLESIIHSKYPELSLLLYRFDYNKKELKLGICNSFSDYRIIVDIIRKNKMYVPDEFFDDLSKNIERMAFVKINEEIIIQQPIVSERSSKIKNLINDELLELYDVMSGYKYFFSCELFSAENAKNIIVNISDVGVILEIRKNLKQLHLLASSRGIEYLYTCSEDSFSNATSSLISGKEDEIFKKTFVKIDNCPKWMQPSLYEIRKEQLLEQKRIEEQKRQEQLEEQKRQEQIKQKIKEFRRFYVVK